MYILFNKEIREKDRHQKDRRTNRQKGRQTGGQKDRRTEGFFYLNKHNSRLITN
jgi:hypothetical protein